MLAAEQASRIQELAAQGNMSPKEIRAGVAPRYVNEDEDIDLSGLSIKLSLNENIQAK